jgi:hypothetical protein
MSFQPIVHLLGDHIATMGTPGQGKKLKRMFRPGPDPPSLSGNPARDVSQLATVAS